MERKLTIAPSILSADFSVMKDEMAKVNGSGVRWVHVDVMDGAFVPNITFGPKFVKDIRKHSDLFFDVHLMIENPENFIEEFAKAGAQAITVHAEACRHLDMVLNRIKALGCLAGVSIVPSTPVESLRDVLNVADMVLVMSVNPGFGGQSYIPYSTSKIARLDAMRKEINPKLIINVDGGVNEKTVNAVVDAGADVVVMGSAFFKAPDAVEFVSRIHEITGTSEGWA